MITGSNSTLRVADSNAGVADTRVRHLPPHPHGQAWLPVSAGAESAVERRFPALRAFGRLVGNTPLIEVPGPRNGATILAKCEWPNPGGSVKDRVVYTMVRRALVDVLANDAGSIRLLEYSGGNLGYALGIVCRALRIPLHLVLSSGSAPSLLERLEELGVEVTLVDKELGFRAVIETAAEIAAADPQYTFLYQHRHPANLACHKTTTGKEILAQLGGRRPAAWLASIGTGGTLIGVADAIREVQEDLLVYGVTPAEAPYGSVEPPNGMPRYAGSGGLGDGVPQPFVAAEESSLAGHLHVSYPDALAGMAEFYDRTGIRIGSSAAANWLAASEVARAVGKGGTVVTLFACAGMPEEWERLGR